MYNTPVDGGLDGGIFAGVVTGIGSFYTFCVEHGTPIVFNQELSYQLSNSTLSSTNPSDPISNATAYLFKKFTDGGFFADPTDVANSTAAGMLQLAIWKLEDQTSAADVNALGANIYYTEALGITDALDDYAGDEVKVMRLIGDNERDVQDVLVYRVSEAGLTIALFGAALTVLGFARRRIS